MQLFNHLFRDNQTLEHFIQNTIDANKNVLVQMFCGIHQPDIIQGVLQRINQSLPLAKVIGVSTAGEIVNGAVQREQINLSFSVFEHTLIRTHYYATSDFASGVQAAQDIVTADTQAGIMFAETLKGDAESFLKGFSSVNDSLILAGGNAADNNNFIETFIIKDATVYYEGLVIATLHSAQLHVSTDYTLAWTPIGKNMQITKAHNNIIYEIDHRPVAELYAYYLGPEVIEHIPASAIEFPLIKEHQGIQIARSIIAKVDNGFVYGGHFEEGDWVRFAIGNIEQVIEEAPKLQSTLAKNPIEATFIYSCSVRDLFVNEHLKHELQAIEEIAPTAGYFSYGEFYHQGNSNQLLNITTTTLSLSESAALPALENAREVKKKNNMLKSLTRLVNTTQGELDDSIRNLTATMEHLETTQKQLIQNEKMATLGRMVAGIAHELNTPIGNSLTVTTSMGEKCRQLINQIESGTLSKSALKDYVQSHLEATRIIEKSLTMAADQVTKFKSVAVDQSNNRKRRFDLKLTIEETLFTLHPQLKHTAYEIQVDIPDNIEMHSYPGPLSQILFNCINNAILHAFDERDTGVIWVTVQQEEAGSESVTLQISDNGKGMTDEQLASIFEPYFTTKLGEGGSGLGMSIVYNLTTEVLKGSVRVESKINQGSTFIFSLPRVVG